MWPKVFSSAWWSERKLGSLWPVASEQSFVRALVLEQQSSQMCIETQTDPRQSHSSSCIFKIDQHSTTLYNIPSRFFEHTILHVPEASATTRSQVEILKTSCKSTVQHGPPLPPWSPVSIEIFATCTKIDSSNQTKYINIQFLQGPEAQGVHYFLQCCVDPEPCDGHCVARHNANGRDGRANGRMDLQKSCMNCGQKATQLSGTLCSYMWSHSSTRQ